MNRTKVILSIFLMLFLLLAGLVLPSFWKSQKKEASGNKGREPAKETTETNSLNSGANASDLYLYTINTKNNVSKPVCENCIYIFGDRVADVFSH